MVTKALLLWTPRVLGILVSLFLGMFALDAFSEGKGLLRAAGELRRRWRARLDLVIRKGS